MFIALVGTPSSGKRAILDYLVSRHGFTRLELDPSISRTSDEGEGDIAGGVDALELDEWVRTSPFDL
jgi:dCMP deaminase